MKRINVQNNLENKININGSTWSSTPTMNFEKEGVGGDDYIDPFKEKGITLIALIITIILMLILAGVVISLTLGENGLFSTAKYAAVKTEEETAKEKLELALADLQTQKYANIDYDENIDIDSYLTSKEMIVIGDIVTVDGWNFKIDRSTPKVEESLGQGEVKTVLIITPYIGTTSFTTKILEVYNEEEIESYIYKIDDEEIATINKEYTTSEEVVLEAESIHTVQVIAKYKDGTQLKSNVVKIKTEPRTYLYNNGDECLDITGGWNGFIFEHSGNYGTEAGYFTKINNRLEFGDNDTTKYGDGGFKTVNPIDTKNYANLCISVKSFNCNFIPRSGYPEAYNGYWITFNGKWITKEYKEDTNISEIVKIKIDNNKENDILQFHTYCSGWGTGGSYIASCIIDAVWLEK